ncbi:hypothetical protein EDC04DRAFT_2909921 [Pisolithus marmoratus]|nr:hypothetical protein EDC04DRAFT_2909921 [Pisolithus marmoratus]
MTPPPGYDLNDPARWSTAKSKISSLKAELYFMLPNNLKLHITYDKFGCVFSNAVGAERPNILKPVKDNAVKVLLKMHPGNVGTRYTPLSPLLFPKLDAPVARDLFKTQLLVNIIQVMIFGKGILAGKCRGGPQGHGQKLGISGTSAGLVAITATFLNGPCQPTPPPCTPSPDLHFSPDLASDVSSLHYIPEVTNAPPATDSVIISQSANSVTSTLGLPAAGRPSSSRMANIPALPPLTAPANTQMPPTKEHHTTCTSHKGKGK